MWTFNQALPVVLGAALLGAGDPTGHGMVDRVVFVFERLAAQLREKGSVSDAERLYRGAMSFCDPGENVPACTEYPRLLNNLGTLLYESGRYAEAEPLLERAIAIWSQAPASLDLASAFANLAACNRAQAKFEDAGRRYKSALRIRQELCGENDFRVALLLNSMAMLAQDLGDYPQGVVLARRAVAVLTSLGDAQSAHLATASATLGGLLRATGDLPEAEERLNCALSIRQRIDGARHRHVAEVLNGLAFVHKLRNQLPQAETLYRRALDIFLEAGVERQAGAALNNLAQVVAEQGRSREARTLYERAIELTQRSMGREHPEVAAELSNYGELLVSLKEYVLARKVLADALRIHERSLPAGHPEIGIDLARAGRLSLKAGRLAEAEDQCSRGLEILDARLGAGNPETGWVAAMLGEVYGRESKLERSEAMYRRAITALSAAWGPGDRRLGAILDHYAGVLRAREDFAEAARVDAEAMRIRVQNSFQ